MEVEPARRRARYYIHDAGRVIYDLLPAIKPMEARKALTEICGELGTIERRLSDLEVDR